MEHMMMFLDELNAPTSTTVFADILWSNEQFSRAMFRTWTSKQMTLEVVGNTKDCTLIRLFLHRERNFRQNGGKVAYNIELTPTQLPDVTRSI